MAIRSKGRSSIEVQGRSFVWWVHDEHEVRIASEDKRFVVAYCWVGNPVVAVSGPEFPGLSSTDRRPVLLRPPAFVYRNPGGLAREVIMWALYSTRQDSPRVTAEPDISDGR